VGPETSLTLSGDDDLLSHVRTQVDNGVLEIDMDGNYEFEADLRVEITTPDLAAFEIDGAGDVEIHGLARDRFSASIDGAGDLMAHGSVDVLEASIDGAGEMSLGDLRARSAHVSSPPASMAITSVRPSTASGVDDDNRCDGPIPSWPCRLSPQHSTRPVVRSAQLWVTPAVTCWALLIERTFTGSARSVVDPSPSWP